MAAQVLVEDEDQAIRQMVRLVLEGEGGYRVLEAATAQEALDHLTAAPAPLVALVNNVLPGRGDAAIVRAVLADRALLAQHVYDCFTANPMRRPPDVHVRSPGGK